MKLKKIIVSVSALALMLGSASNAFACTALYVGGELQQEIFADFDAMLPIRRRPSKPPQPRPARPWPKRCMQRRWRCMNA